MAVVTGLRSVELGVRDLTASTDFYARVWGLEPVVQTATATYLRATGPHHHVLGLHARARSEILCIDLMVDRAASLESLRKAVYEGGGQNCGPIAPLGAPGGGIGFSFKDPEGRSVRIVAEDRRHDDVLAGRDRPSKLSHIVLNAGDRAAMADFYSRTLGFRIIDRTAGMTFLNCGKDHHSIAFATDVSRAVNHIAFEMPDIESVMRGAGRLCDHGYAIEWGVGRHGPGNNVFAYFVGPNGEVIEYTADVQQVDDSYRPGEPEDWKWPPGRGDHWGIAVGPTERMKAAQRRITFADEPPPA